ncbi:hypothetical protein B0T26DRAFT_652490 [Lasiosphaeria miniovina]|uniref:DUF676 domain-containing protein n=1 Tax=Lasiosphaeria miniovina TaxID=1954250 RepID=A0AA40A593_9PEZI|nr:uncharacterized protein B0T26DRAFT_652490 [Lasiosphaeria miniovina]KAK0709554.1 hypothetical protein B0T26DRAFT_652490 [Lasiosphaeria miniovina]
MTRESGLTASSIPESDLEPGFAVIDGDLPGAGNGHNDTYVDIIAVPCPGADPVKTWTSAPLPDHYFGLEPQNELQRLPTVAKLAGNVILSPVIDRNLPRAGHVWVRQDIRSKVNTARVLLYRHRALADEMRLEDLARDLLDKVKQVRQGNHSPRPLFFIGHSIGGLVVKLALLLASKTPLFGQITSSCHGVSFFGTPHRGSSYMSMKSLKRSIRQLLHLQRPLPRSLADELSLNHPGLSRLHEQFVDIASEFRLWSLYETQDSQLSGTGAGLVSEVQFEAPLVSIKSALLDIWQEDIFSVDSNHAHLASFGPDNINTMTTYLADLTAAIAKAQDLSTKYAHTPLHLENHVHVEVIGFYPDTAGDVDSATTRLYSSKNSLTEFLEKGPEACLGERMHKIPRRHDSHQYHGHDMLENLGRRAQESSGVSGLGVDEQSPSGSTANPLSSKAMTASPGIVVTDTPARPPIQPLSDSGTLSEGLAGHSLSVPNMPTRPPSIDSRASVSTASEPAIQLSALDSATFPAEQSIHFDALSRQRAGLLMKASAMQDELVAGFSRPDPALRKFIWIHLPFNNPVWVKTLFEKLRDTVAGNYSVLFEYDHWEAKTIQNRHSESQPAFMKPICNYLPPESILSPRIPSPFNPLASSSPRPSYLYLYFPYLHFDTYSSVIRRRSLIQRRRDHGRANPVPEDVSKRSLESQVIWEYVGFDPPLNPRRTLDQFGHHSLQDTHSRDDDQMLYKLTKKLGRKPLAGTTNRARRDAARRDAGRSLRVSSSSLKREHSSGRDSPADPEKDVELEMEADLKPGNLLMVDQLWLWAIDTTTLTTYFPKRESNAREGRLFQQADLRNSVYNELNGDLTGRTDNALDLAALIVFHAVIVFLERSTHPDLEMFRIFEEAIGMLSERMTLNMKQFRTQTLNPDLDDDSSNAGDCDSASDTDSDSDLDPDVNSAASIKRRHQREMKRAEDENRENTSALLELRDMEDELSILNKLFDTQDSVIKSMKTTFTEREELRNITTNGQAYLDEAVEYLDEFKEKTNEMLKRIETTRRDYEKMLEMAQRQAQVDEVRWSRLQAELASSQNLSVMIFTTFTVIFLPLTFFTGLFGMNTSEWQEEGNLPSLSDIGAISLPTSVFLILASLAAAFSWRVQRMFKLTYRFAKRAWKGYLRYVSKVEPAWRKQSKKRRKLEKRRRLKETQELGENDRAYDFWATIRNHPRNAKYHIPHRNRNGL